MSNLIDNNYDSVAEFISPEEAEILANKYRADILNFPKSFVNDIQCPASLAIYDYREFLPLLVEKTALVSKILGEPVLPTYCYARSYRRGEVLAKHVDRAECEVSVTLHLGGDGSKWPIYMTKPNGDVIGAELSAGQAIAYMGCVSEHWRDAFEGDEYIQVFLHYVKLRGDNWLKYFDKLGE